ncbi:hypothetical protein [Flavobacterium sp.]|uniref:hypothetical protein n=1 Tax=Flavobacterium sp. TaxID=239 RepID=UPI00286E8787|nr:hypothetical protein [Flavobacterium sp.]
MKKIITIFLIFTAINYTNAQEEQKVRMTVGEGIIVAGYVNDGGYINFTGPSIKIIHKPYLVCIGVLPSLRFKEDKVAVGAPKNSTITPSLGFGLTFAYKHLAFQVPAYYNGKTAKADGLWHLGLGLGYKF